jgi:hypothetical protein
MPWKLFNVIIKITIKKNYFFINNCKIKSNNKIRCTASWDALPCYRCPSYLLSYGVNLTCTVASKGYYLGITKGGMG